MKKTPLPLFILFCLFLLSLPALAFSPATCLRVVDGDTLKVRIDDRQESVRLIGIDTPESRVNKKAFRDAQRSRQDVDTITGMGKRAEAFTKTLVRKGDVIRLEFDVQQRDRYRRLLAYVYLDDGKMLNEEIVKAGYAQPMTIPPNAKYQDRLLKAYREARNSNRGLWK